MPTKNVLYFSLWLVENTDFFRTEKFFISKGHSLMFEIISHFQFLKIILFGNSSPPPHHTPLLFSTTIIPEFLLVRYQRSDV